MLVYLNIKNYALIDALEMSLTDGLTTITGETGAGKSILIGALSMILGSRTDKKALKDDQQKCIVEATFEIKKYDLNAFFDEQGLDYQDSTYIRRELLPSGKSRAFINDTPVNLDVLKNLAQRLIDIHSQYETQKIIDTDYYYHIIDTLAGHRDTLLKKYTHTYTQYQQEKKKLEELITYQETANKNYEYDSFSLQELKQLSLEEGLQESLEQEIDALSNIEEIHESVSEMTGLLQQEDYGLLTTVTNIKSILSRLSGYGNVYQSLIERVNEVQAEMVDISREVDGLSGNMEFDPDHLETLNQRLQRIYDLQKKHQVETFEELMQVQQALEESINAVDNIEEDIAQQNKIVKKLDGELRVLGQQLFEKRKETITVLQTKLEQLLTYLGMPNAQFQFDLTLQEELQSNGTDSMKVLFSANKGANYGELKKVASGGERSRIMLSIKYILSEYTNLPTIIFDEIDTGVSGEVAIKIAQMMNQLATRMQVLTITHLPQIACKGSHHYKVYKDTNTHVKLLSEEERVNEIAEMLSGKEMPESAKQHARELLSGDKR